MKIENHKLTGEDIMPFEQSSKVSGGYKEGRLDTLIIHYTASPTFKSAYNTMMVSDRQASAHLLLDWDGKILQMADFQTKTWHAGKSEYQGRKFYNQYSIGIEIVNPGPLFKKGDHFIDVYGIKYSPDKAVKAVHRNNPKMSDYWHIYTREQINAVYAIARLLVAEYGIKHILGHEEIAVGRKSDPGPAFPLDQLREDILGVISNNPSGDSEAVEVAEPIEIDASALRGWVSKKYVEVNNSDNGFDGIVTAPSLNIRASNSGSSEKVAEALTKGTKIDILQTVGGWLEVVIVTDEPKEGIVPTVEGWVSAKYIKDGIVNVSHLNIRASNSGSSEKVADALLQGTKVNILETVGSWHRVAAYV